MTRRPVTARRILATTALVLAAWVGPGGAVFARGETVTLRECLSEGGVIGIGSGSGGPYSYCNGGGHHGKRIG